MTRTQIVAELRRSAIEDQRPWIGCAGGAWHTACNALAESECGYEYSSECVAMYFLIVACALEGE